MKKNEYFDLKDKIQKDDNLAEVTIKGTLTDGFGKAQILSSVTQTSEEGSIITDYFYVGDTTSYAIHHSEERIVINVEGEEITIKEGDLIE